MKVWEEYDGTSLNHKPKQGLHSVMYCMWSQKQWTSIKEITAV